MKQNSIDGSALSPTADASNLNRYLPAPKNGAVCPISGFGHSRFYQKVVNGAGRKHVRIVDLREPGEARGTKFYHVGDLLGWLNSLAEKQAKEEVAA